MPDAAALAGLLVDATRDLCRARRQRDTWRVLALSALDHLNELNMELEMVSHRRATYRRHVQEIERGVDRAFDEEVAA